jgi:hypothetical protein
MKVVAIEFTGYTECLSKLTRSISQGSASFVTSIPLQQRSCTAIIFDWFNGTNKYTSTIARRAGNNIATVVHAVGKVYVQVAGRCKHRGVSTPRSTKRMARFVVLIIALSLNNPHTNNRIVDTT